MRYLLLLKNGSCHKLITFYSLQVLYPSGFFYINGVFYNDTRHPDAKLYSDNILKWKEKHSEVGM